MNSNPLVNVLTPTIRRYAYAVLFVAALVFATYKASNGDWTEFTGGLITALLGLTAASNASTTPVVQQQQQQQRDDAGADPDDL